MRDLVRRIAILSLASALGIALLAPLAARSAVAPRIQAAAQLLDAAAHPPRQLGDRGDVGRAASALRTLAVAPATTLVEHLVTSATPAARAPNVVLAPRLVTVATARPTAAPTTPPAAGPTVSGRATWYCCSLGYRGKAVVALAGALGGHYDPTASWFVTICADRCARLPVVDYCQCYWGTAAQKVADLSPEAWAAISDSPLSAGVIRVTIDLGR